jgi:acetyl-CoA carboxylase biotin carboxyl carrier protein
VRIWGKWHFFEVKLNVLAHFRSKIQRLRRAFLSVSKLALAREFVSQNSPQPNNTLDLKQIKQVIDLMKRSELSEFAFEEEGFKLKIRRGASGLPVVSSSGGYSSNHPFNQVSAPAPAQPAAPAPAPAAAAAAAAAVAAADEVGVVYIKSPMVGTFYRSASPESKPYAENGTKVVETSVVCIIEAMKIMNEIQSEVKGTIVESLVENGQPVEYGQKLFKVKQG